MQFPAHFKSSLYVKSEVKDGEFTDSSVTIFNFLRILILSLDLRRHWDSEKIISITVIVSQSQTESALSWQPEYQQKHFEF